MLKIENIHEIIKEIVVGFDASELKDDQDFIDAGIDSLDHSNILLAIEEKTNVPIPDDEVENCSTINGIIKFLNSQ